MLESIRKNVRHPYIQVLLGMIILVFILFFGWSASTQRPSYLAKVNGDTIDYRSYQRAYEGLTSVYQQVFGSEATPERIKQLGLGRRALDQLVDEVLLLQEADRRGIKVTKADVQAAIAAVPAFQGQGGFELKRYEMVLGQNRLTAAEYEQMKEREILLTKAQQSIEAEAKVSEDEIRAEYEAVNTTAEFEYVAFDPAALRQAVAVSEKDLQSAYESQKESFRVPEKRVARYVLFAADRYVADVQATDEEIQREFNALGSQIEEKEAVKARHILLQVPEGAAPDQEAAVRKKAEALLKEAKAAKDFGALAKKFSEDPGSKDKGGDLGYFERGQMVPEFDKVAFSLKPGQVSDLVKTQFGFHILKVEDRRQGGRKTLEQLKPQIEAEVKRRKALEQAYKAADGVLVALEDKKETWEGLAKKNTVTVSDPVARGSALEGTAKPRELANLLFSLDPAKPGNLMESDRGTYLVAVEKVIPSAIPPFQDVKAQVEARYREAEAKKLAEKKAAEFLETAKKSGWDAAVRAAGLKSESTGQVTKKGAPPAKLPWSEEMRDAAFALTTVGALCDRPYTVQDKAYALRLSTRTPADPAGLAAQKDKLAAELLPVKQRKVLEEKLKKLKAEAKIKINEEMML